MAGVYWATLIESRKRVRERLADLQKARKALLDIGIEDSDPTLVQVISDITTLARLIAGEGVEQAVFDRILTSSPI